MKEQRHFEPTSIVLLSLSLGSNLFCPLVLSPGGGGGGRGTQAGGAAAANFEQYIWQGYALLQHWTDTADGGERASEGAREGGKAASQKSKKPRDGHEINRQLWGRMRGREGTERWPAHRRLCLSVCLRSLSCNGDGEDWLAIHFPIPLSHGSG